MGAQVVLRYSPQDFYLSADMSASFNAIDSNHDGVITRSEFNAAMQGSVNGDPVSFAAAPVTYTSAPMTYAAPAATYATAEPTYTAAAQTYAAPAMYAAPTYTAAAQTYAAPATYSMPAVTTPVQPTAVLPATTYTLPTATSMVAYPQYTYQSGAYAQPVAPAGF